MTWVSISPKPPTVLQDIGSAISQGLNALRSSLELIKTEAQATTLLATATESATVSLAETALNLVITTINDALNSILDSSGLYVLPIPIPKKGLARLVEDATTSNWNETPTGSSETGSNYVTVPINNIAAKGTPAEKAILQNSLLYHEIFYPNDILLGGNAHFLKTVSEALSDPYDPNRPQFNTNSYWAYTIMLAGSSDVSSIIKSASFFDRLIGGSKNTNHVGASAGLANLVPENVRVTPSGRNNFAIVQWNLVPVSRTLQSYDRSHIIATKYAVIRSSNMKVRAAHHVTDLFSTRNLTTGLTGNFDSQVLTVDNYDGVINRYIDENTLTEGVTYYYQIAFATRIEPALAPLIASPTTTDTPEPKPQDLGFDLLSSAVEFRKPTRRNDYTSSKLGKSPDWIRTPSIISLIPPLSQFIDQVQEYLRTAQGTARNISTQNDQYITFLNQEINRYATKITAFENQLQNISNVFNAPTAGIYATLRTGTGNSTSFLTDLITAFENDSDDNRPPFMTGDEYVTGIIMLAIGPDSTLINAALALMEALFTSGNSDDPALTGINSINTQLATAEADLINKLTNGTNPNPMVGFNNDMTSAATNEGCR